MPKIIWNLIFFSRHPKVDMECTGADHDKGSPDDVGEKQTTHRIVTKSIDVNIFEALIEFLCEECTGIRVFQLMTTLCVKLIIF